MKIFLCTSRYLYDKVQPIADELIKNGHTVTFPNSFDDAGLENRMKTEHTDSHPRWKAEMLRKQTEKVAANDAILVLNFKKNGKVNYVGGATFLEIFKAWELGKRIYFYNPLPEEPFHDELVGMSPVVIFGDLSKI